MIGRNDAGEYVCKAHRRFRGSEAEAAEHLREYHGELWARLADVEVVPLNNRAEKRRARRAVAAQRARARRAARGQT